VKLLTSPTTSGRQAKTLLPLPIPPIPTPTPRAWFTKFSSVVAQLGFVPSAYDSALFLWTTNTGTIFILLYVDDMIITGDDI
jgi:hypothetical protein